MPELQSGEQAQQWLAQWQSMVDPSASGSSCMPGLPPEEVSLTALTPPATVQGQPNSQELFNENDFLGPGLNMAEFYEDVEDVGHAAARISGDAAAVVNGTGPLSFEEVVAFIDQNPQVTERSMDPSYALLAAEAANAYPHRVYNYFPEPYTLDPPPAPPYPGEIAVEAPSSFPEAVAPAQTIAPSQTMLSSASAGPSQTVTSPFSEATSPTYAPSPSVAPSQSMDASQAMVDWFHSPMLSFLQGPLTSPPPSTAASTPAPGSAMVPEFSLPQDAHSAGAFFQFQQVVAAPELQQVVPIPEPIESASAPQPSRRYVPPSGAGLTARRRVGQRYTAPPARLGADPSEASGSA
ncbi:hypothetical protein C8Q73DRAFT_480020 [Cubamyces lactineus]|nr:hypothetical protein C8Q73DRAFT_480020 [Cubamyces lactineus]